MKIQLKHKEVISAIEVEKITLNTFRILENALHIEKLYYDSEISVQLEEEGIFVFQEIIKPSPYFTIEGTLPRSFKQSDFNFITDEIEKMNGHFDVFFNYMYIVNIPTQHQKIAEEFLATFID